MSEPERPSGPPGEPPAFLGFAAASQEGAGVHGWLALLVLGLAYLCCDLLVECPGLLRNARLLPIGVAQGAIALLGLLTCLALLRHRRHAPAWAIAWFATLGCGYLAEVAAAWYFTRLVNPEWLPRLGLVALAIVYLRRSARVRATYPGDILGRR